MDSHAASYTGVLDSFLAAAITAHLMLEDWSFEPFNHLWLALHPLLLQWYHQRSHSQHMQAKVPLAQVPLAQVPYNSSREHLWSRISINHQIHCFGRWWHWQSQCICQHSRELVCHVLCKHILKHGRHRWLTPRWQWWHCFHWSLYLWQCWRQCWLFGQGFGHSIICQLLSLLTGSIVQIHQSLLLCHWRLG